jgi:hypothetical protein
MILPANQESKLVKIKVRRAFAICPPGSRSSRERLPYGGIIR